MKLVVEWLLPAVLWVTVTVGAHGLLLRLGVVRGRADWGLSILAGFSLYTGLVYLLALIGVPIGLPLVLGGAAVVLGAGILARQGIRPPAREREPWSPAERVLLVAFALYAIMNLEGILYLPVTGMDAHSYAGRALYLLHDGRLDLAIYHWPVPLGGNSNLTYPPLYSLALAVPHAFGAWQPKVVNVFFALAWPLVIYGGLREHLPRPAALTWALILGFTPEVFAHMSLALINAPAMVLITGETISLARYVETGQKRWSGLAAILAAGASGVRPDAVVVHAVLCLLALYVLVSRGGRSRNAMVPLVLAGLAPLLIWGTWTVYARTVIGFQADPPFGGDSVIGLGLVARKTLTFTLNWETFGVVFWAWAMTLPFLASFRVRGAAVFYQASALAVLVVLALLFSGIKTSFGGGPEEFLGTSYKRDLFYVVSLAGIAAALSPPWTMLVRAGNRWFCRSSA